MATDDREKVTVPIRIKKSLLKELKAYGNMHESYSDVIERLLRKKTDQEEKEETDFAKNVEELV